MKAVLIDDEIRALTSLRTLLNKWCPEVEVVAECQTAFEAFNKITLMDPQIIFMDINMPDKNGFDLLREFPKPEFEVIFVTAYDDFMMRHSDLAP